MNAGFTLKLILLAAVLLLLPAGQAFAADFYVPRDCTLASAITAANTNTATGGCAAGDAGADTIHLTSNVNLGANLPKITESLTIDGRHRIISGQDTHSCLKVDTHGATLTTGIALSLKRLIVSNCKAVRNQSDTDGEPGGAIDFSLVNNGDAASSLSLDRVTLRHSQTHDADTNQGGGGLNAHAWGGPLTVTINRSAIHDNRTTRYGAGGGIAFSRNIRATITNTSIFDNYADQRGGGIFWTGQNASTRSLTLNHVTITKNESTSEHGNLGGGMYFFHGTLVMHNSIIAGNISTTENGSNCRVRPQSLTFTDRSNNIAGTGSTNCPTISVAGSAVTDAKLAANPTNRAGTRYYDLTSGSAAVNRITTCTVAVDQRGYPRPWPAGGACDIGAIEFGSRLHGGGGGNGGESGDVGGSGSAVEEGASAKPPAVMTCLTLPGVAVYNANPGSACQLVSGASIGHPDVARANPASVVDVWGWVTPNTQVCFQGSSGSIRFIDTAAMPRTVATLPTFSMNGMICAAINGPGQVALIADGSAPSASAPASPVTAQSLSGCMVRTKYNLNFRDAPAGEKIGGVPFDATLTALERTVGWFKVDYHGAQGWIAAMFVEPIGTCG